MRSFVALTLFLLLCGNVFAATTSAETNIFAITSETLPVELSSFSAVQTASGMVSLKWITASETGLLGYRVYRAESIELVGAIQISTHIISATNTSTTQVYSFEDREVELDHSYYYWLESVEYQHSDFHGPISITINGSTTPELPIQTVLGAIYPNPFRHGTPARFEVMVKDSDRAQVSIYNLLGQRVKSYQLQPGSHQLYWDGRDHSGKPCGSGIYLVKLSSGTFNQSAKIMLIK